MTTIVTSSLLRKLGACRKEVQRFRVTFPFGLPVSEDGINKAWQEDFKVSWLVYTLSSPEEETPDFYVYSPTRNGTLYFLGCQCDQCKIYRANNPERVEAMIKNVVDFLIQNIEKFISESKQENKWKHI